MRIFLVGFMGAGKSFLGRALADSLGFGFVDLDDRIESALGMSIGEAFMQLGEAGFRNQEGLCLRNLVDETEDIVVATGGGTPCFHQNMDWMNEHGITIYIHAPVELLIERLRPEKSFRPLLATVEDGDLDKSIQAKLEERVVFYEQCHIQFEAPRQGTVGIDALVIYLKRFFQKK